MLDFHGVHTAIVTPFLPTGELDLPSFSKLLNFQKSEGISGVVISGTTGESPTLEEGEFVKLVKEAKGVFTSEKKPVIVGTGTNSTKETLKKSLLAKELGADALLVVTPYYNKPSQQGLTEHYLAVAKAVAPLPVILYDVPGRTGVKIEPDTLEFLAKNQKNIIGIKDATGDLNRIARFRNTLGKDFLILSGDDPLFLPSLAVGANGIISVASNLIPGPMMKMFSNPMSELATKEHQRLIGFFNGIFVESNPVPIKWALFERKLISSPTVRPPLSGLLSKNKDGLLQIMKDAQI